MENDAKADLARAKAAHATEAAAVQKLLNDAASAKVAATRANQTAQAQAKRAAEAAGRAAQICLAMPATVNTAGGAPSLADTLHFIEEKLSDSGGVNNHRIYQKPDGSPRADIPVSWRLTQVAADPSRCLIRFNERVSTNGKVTADARVVVSFRRLEKLEVIPEQDVMNRQAGGAGSGSVRTEPVVYLLSALYLGGEKLELVFHDEEITNRIAKAMTHAVELCGGGSKDPF